jgi:hypothetical protein
MRRTSNDVTITLQRIPHPRRDPLTNPVGNGDEIAAYQGDSLILRFKDHAPGPQIIMHTFAPAI